MNTYTRLTSSDYTTAAEDELLSRFVVTSDDDTIVYDASALEAQVRTVYIDKDCFLNLSIPENSQDEFLTGIRHEFERLTDCRVWGYGNLLAKIKRLKKGGFTVIVDRDYD